MKDTLFEFAEAVLKGRDLLRKADSAEQACKEAEARLKKLAEKESESAANLAKAEKQAKRIADSLLEQAEKKASGIVQDAEERAESVKSGVQSTLEDARKEIDLLSQTKTALVAEVNSAREVVTQLEVEKESLFGVVSDLRKKLRSV